MTQAIAEFPIDDVVIECMLMHLIRCPQVFTAGMGRLDPQLFNQPGEYAYYAVWRTTLEYYSNYRHLPEYSMLSTAVVARLRNDTGAMPEAEQTAVDFLNWAFGPRNPESSFAPAAALDMLRAFLVQRQIEMPLRNAIMTAGRRSMTNLPALLEEAQQLTRQLGVLRDQPDGTPIKPIWSDQPRVITSTGDPLFDRFMDGGNEPGEVNVLIGPTGVGKSLTATQLAVGFARMQRSIVERGGVGKLCALVGYEEPEQKMRIRVLANAAEIPKTRLRRIQTYNDLSTPGTLQEYERDRFRGEPQILSEQERVARCSPWLNQYLRLVDLHSQPMGVSRGRGGFAEIRHSLDHYQQLMGIGVGCVILDWAGLAASLWETDQAGTVDKVLYVKLKTFVSDFYNDVIAPCGATGWVMHQLKGALNDRPPTTPSHHSEADYCSSFANNAAYAFCLGTKDVHTNACLLTCSKSRDAAAQPCIPVRIDGEFQRLADASNELTVDGQARRIVSRAEAERIHDFQPAAPRRGVPGIRLSQDMVL